MNSDPLDPLLRTFRRQLAWTQGLRIAGVVTLTAAVIGASRLPEPTHKRALLIVLGAVLLAGLALVLRSVRLTREVQAGSVLLNTGQLKEAEIWFRRAIGRFSLSTRARLIACEQMASLLFRRDAHPSVVAICRELLRHRRRWLRRVQFNARLLLADSLLLLDRVGEAYQAIHPVYHQPLSLLERMKLLPVQLRYELAADHSDAAVQDLADKTRIGELLDSPRAALVHALLAEACHRESMAAQGDFFAERAWLYYDLSELAERYPLITPMIARSRDTARAAESERLRET